MGKADNPDEIQYVLSVDSDDPLLNEYDRVFANSKVTWYENNNHSAIEAINNAAKVATGDILLVCSDDFSCPEHWDTQLLTYLKGKSDFVVKTADGLQPWIITLPIMDRVYYERFGYVYYPEYKHLFCDTEMTCVGDLLDKTILVPMLFQHNHYTQAGGIKKDAISVKNDATWGQGERLYIERIKRNFDLPESEIKGTLRCDNVHLQWLKSKGVKFETA